MFKLIFNSSTDYYVMESTESLTTNCVQSENQWDFTVDN